MNFPHPSVKPLKISFLLPSLYSMKAPQPPSLATSSPTAPLKSLVFVEGSPSLKPPKPLRPPDPTDPPDPPDRWTVLFSMPSLLSVSLTEDLSAAHTPFRFLTVPLSPLPFAASPPHCLQALVLLCSTSCGSHFTTGHSPLVFFLCEETTKNSSRRDRERSILITASAMVTLLVRPQPAWRPYSAPSTFRSLASLRRVLSVEMLNMFSPCGICYIISLLGLFARFEWIGREFQPSSLLKERPSASLLHNHHTVAWSSFASSALSAVSSVNNGSRIVVIVPQGVLHFWFITRMIGLSDVAKEFNVTRMPTFVLVKRGKEIERIVGANKDQLEKKVSKHRA